MTPFWKGVRRLGILLLMWMHLHAQAGGNASPLYSRCVPSVPLVDAVLRDAALGNLRGLMVRAPGRNSDGAVLRNAAPGHIDRQGKAWYHVAAYEGNLGMLGALWVDASLLDDTARWLRWQARHVAPPGPRGGELLEHWVSGDHGDESICPPDIAPERCSHVDATDSSLATFFLLTDAYLARGGGVALLDEPVMRAALVRSAETLTRLQLPNGLTWAKQEHRVAYLMDNLEAQAGWEAWARVLQRLGDPQGAQGARLHAQQIHTAIETTFWDERSRTWRVSSHAAAAQLQHWYPDSMAQAWPLLWSGSTTETQWQARRGSWQRTQAGWLQRADSWPQRNVDPDGFWWPAAAVAAQCSGQTEAARVWVARARQVWLEREPRFAWPFQVSDLLWLFWMSEPLPLRPSP